MHRLLILIVILTTCALASAAAEPWKEWRNSLKPSGTPGKPITLIQDGMPQYNILIPQNASPQEKKAADDLSHWVEQITGKEMSILPNRVNGAKYVVIETAKDGSLGEEGYSIALNGDDLVLKGGTTRGIVNAVYALLEEDAGCRWYSKTHFKLPKTATLTIAPVARTYTPRLRVRDPFWFVAFDPEWSLWNRTNAEKAKVPEESGGYIDYGGFFVHTVAFLLPPEKYFKEHPEYYMLHKDGKRQPWQWCPTEPETAKVVTANVLAALKKSPHTEIISVSKNDSGGDQLCQCERCKKLRADEGAEIATQLVLVNAVAEAVEKEYPNVVMDTLAYLDTIAVPKTVRPRKNVAIRLCNDTVGAWSRPFTSADKLPVAKIAKDWAAACKRIYIWDYHVNFSHYLAPMPNIEVIAANIRFWVENNAEGVMLQAAYQSTAERDYLKSWVSAKLLWDPSRDENELVQDFIWGHYGAAAPALAEYDALLVKQGKDHEKDLAGPPGGIRYEMNNPFLTKEFLDQSAAILAKGKEQAKGDEALLHRVERAELPIQYVKLSRGAAFVGDDYGKVLDEFVRVSKRENVKFLAEGGEDFEPKVAAWRKAMTKEISHGGAAGTYQAFPDICRLKNGDLLCAFYAGYSHVSLPADDDPKGGRICMVRSSDDGKTWSAPEVLYDDEDDNRDSHLAQLDDGSIVCTFFGWRHKGARLKSVKDLNLKTFTQIAAPTGATIVRSTDNGKTWETKPTIISTDWFSSAPVRQLSDGTCVLGIYCEDAKTKLDRPGVVRSADRFKTWETPVTIPTPPGVSLAAETDVIQCKDGSLFAALRGDKIHMHFSRSTDGGKTWSTAQDIGFDGHCPHLNRLSTGDVILCHRLPKTSIHISRDDTKTWQGPYMIDDVIGAYPSTVELKDGTVLIVYYTEGATSHIRAKRFRVKPDGIEMLPL